ncbi:peptidoglycan recognition protein family protein [Mycobacteroides abscessus]|uniref:peptidoglycan recognition protein family protein n=2 Tax=Mycobacteroides abscessus TaxID=36809 RepID=UPI002E8DF9E1|nr:N-acetylmuramoyl-L-alanine amidase [Mycobacteroides abscessus]
MDGWRESGTGGQMGRIWGVMIHHTGNRTETKERIRSGRIDLAGPLAQCLIEPDGTCWLVAVGPCNHAGAGTYPGIPTNDGNRVLIGFECAWPLIHPDGSYDQHERWPDAQIITMRDATAAVLQQLGYGPERVIGHKEYATHYPNIKWDPGNLDMDWFRSEVGKALSGQFQTLTAQAPRCYDSWQT